MITVLNPSKHINKRSEIARRTVLQLMRAVEPLLSDRENRQKALRGVAFRTLR